MASWSSAALPLIVPRKHFQMKITDHRVRERIDFLPENSTGFLEEGERLLGHLQMRYLVNHLHSAVSEGQGFSSTFKASMTHRKYMSPTFSN